MAGGAAAGVVAGLEAAGLAAGVDAGVAVPGVAVKDPAVPYLVRNGKNGVTSNGIFSDAEFSATGLVLISSRRLPHGSTFTRPPRGSAAI